MGFCTGASTEFGTLIFLKDLNSYNSTTYPTASHPYRENVDVFKDDGIAGQGNEDPPSIFNLHYITKSGGNYYDPSYGTDIVEGGDIDKKHEDMSFAGFGLDVIPDPANGEKVLIIRKNNSFSVVTSEVDYNVSN